MIIQCDKCQSKFKLDDSKVTEKGVKVKCKKCQNIFTVYPEKKEEELISLFEEKLEVKEEPKKEEVSFELPSFEFSMDTKKEEVKEAVPKEEPKEEFSWDQFSIDIEEKKKEEPIKEEEEKEEIKFDFESFQVDKEEKPKEEGEKVEFEFDFEKLGITEKEEERPEEQKTIEEFLKETPEKETFEFEVAFEGEKKEATPEEEKKVETFEFEGFKLEEEKPEEKVSLEEFKFEESEQEAPVESIGKEEEAQKEFVFEGIEAEVEKEEKIEMPEREFEKRGEKEELSFTFLEEEKKITFPQEEFKKEEEPIPFIAEEVKPRSGLLVMLVSLLIVIVFSGTGIGFVWWQKTKMLEKEGTYGISEVKAEFLESKTLGNVFVVKGKITNAYRVPKSFLKVKCVLYSKDNKKLAEKIAFASNVFTPDEIRELTYSEIEKGLNNKMGKSMMNVNVPAGKAIPFMLVFDKIPEGVNHLEVEAI